MIGGVNAFCHVVQFDNVRLDRHCEERRLRRSNLASAEPEIASHPSTSRQETAAPLRMLAMTKVKELLVRLEEPSGCGIVAAILA
jgi:hypothetical protein